MVLTPGQLGALCAMVGVFFFSVNDTTIKFISGDYALHQIVLIRSVIGLILMLVLLAPFNGGLRVFHTKKPVAHVIRGGVTVIANMTLFLAFAALPLADATAIFFISPILITLFSMIFLKERVGPWRWLAIAIGFVGVLVMMRPGTDAFQVASLYSLAGALAYAALVTMTRRMGVTESALTMAVYIQIMFILVSICFGLVIGDGWLSGRADPSLDFLLRAWSWPAQEDYPLFLLVGFCVAGAGYLISQAYRVAQPAFVAPFEYIALPLAVFWGIVVFDEWPDLTAYVGMALIALAGIVTIWREAVNAKAARPVRRGG